MKKFFLLCAVIFIGTLSIPLVSLKVGNFSFKNISEKFTQPAGSEGPVRTDDVGAAETDRTVKVMSVSSGNIITTDELDYIVGCVACEMPATYHEEALKAQAVAAYTNLQRLRKNPDASLSGADISDSPSKHQGYYTEEQQREKWGDKYDAYRQKIENAVREVLGEVILYDGEPIVAAYCALCPGRTEDASVIWQGDIPYLKSVVSSGDRLSPDYSVTTVMSIAEFRDAVKNDSEIVLPDDPAQWIKINTLSENHTGVVKSVTVGNKEMDGVKARRLFSLRSPAFTVSFANGSFTFTANGYGHCVGMSQYGADYMAQNGSSYKEILRHYYKGVKIERG